MGMSMLSIGAGLPAAMVNLLILIWEESVILPIMGRSSGYGKYFWEVRIRWVRGLAQGNHARAWVIDPTRLPLRWRGRFPACAARTISCLCRMTRCLYL